MADGAEEPERSNFSDLKARFESLSRSATPSPAPSPSLSPAQRHPSKFSITPPTPTPGERFDGVEKLRTPTASRERGYEAVGLGSGAGELLQSQRSLSGPPLTASASEGSAEVEGAEQSLRLSMRGSFSHPDLLDSAASEAGVRAGTQERTRGAELQGRATSSRGVESSSTSRTVPPSPPIPPLATRPSLLPEKRAPPPPPPSRRILGAPSSHPVSPVRSPSREGTGSPESSTPPLPLSQPKIPTPELQATPSLPLPRSPSVMSDTSSPISFASYDSSNGGDNPFDSSSSPGEISRSESRSSAIDALPPIPPRPSLPRTASPPPITSKPPPPPIPVRLSQSSSSTSLPPPALPPPAGYPAPIPPLASSLPPPPRKSFSTVTPSSRPSYPHPRTITRPSPPLVASPAPIGEPWKPPPPPSRAIAPTEKLAPLRPAISSSSPHYGEDSSSEEEEDSTTKSFELPDQTYANRRPPALRNRRSLKSHTTFWNFAIRSQRVVTGGQNHTYVWNLHTSNSQKISLPDGEAKVHAVEFKAGDLESPDDGRYAWGGTREGGLFEVDTVESKISAMRVGLHLHSVTGIFRLGRLMMTLDESGKLLVFGSANSETAADLNSTPKVQRIGEKHNFAAIFGNELWTSSGPHSKPGAGVAASRTPQIRVYDPTGNGPFAITPRAVTAPESTALGSVTAGAIVPYHPEFVYLAHDNGYTSCWDRTKYTCVSVQRVSPYGITGMAGVGRFLWCGFRTGFICVYDVGNNFLVVKAWKAHKEAVMHITVDCASLWTDQTLQVASAGSDMVVHVWDGLLRDDWLDSELHLRQREFCTYRSLRVLCVSWNVDAAKPQDLSGQVNNYEFLQQCLSSLDSPDIISFGFQEMIDLESKKLTAKSLLLGKKKAEQKFTDGVSSSYRLWHDKLIQAVRLVMPPSSPYTVVHVGDMVGLFSCIFVKTAELDGLRDVALTTVKTGMRGKYGNKGAILSRFVIDDTSLCFINCHLAAGQSHRRQRDHDLVNILEERSGFSDLASSSPGAYAGGGGGTSVFDHEVCILSGDLNYRIDQRRDTVAAAVAKNDLASLFPHDQLLKGLVNSPTFRLRSFNEAPITFAPTYKYDPGTDDYDSSTKKRIPAWCDRVLWRADRGEKVKPLHYRRYECNISDHRPISAGLEVEVKKIVKEKRALVWEEVENAWFGVESDQLHRAREYYAGM